MGEWNPVPAVFGIPPDGGPQQEHRRSRQGSVVHGPLNIREVLVLNSLRQQIIYDNVFNL